MEATAAVGSRLLSLAVAAPKRVLTTLLSPSSTSSTVADANELFLSKSNATGYLGVYGPKPDGKFEARYAGMTLGYFDTAVEAATVYSKRVRSAEAPGAPPIIPTNTPTINNGRIVVDQPLHLLMINVASSLSGFQWQAFVPTLPLALVEGLGHPPRIIGEAYIAFIGTSFLGYLLLPSVLKHASPYSVLRRSYELRALSALLHITALTWARDTDYRLVVPIVLFSRAVHGLTLWLVPLSFIWIGTQADDSDKPNALAFRNLSASLGITFGLFAGAVATMAFDEPIEAGLAPGWLLLFTSLAMWFWLGVSFTHRQLIGQQREENDDDAKSDASFDAARDRSSVLSTPWIHIHLVSFTNLFGWMGYLCIEGSLTLVLIKSFKWQYSDIIYGWLPTALSILFGTLAFASLQSKCEWKMTSLFSLAEWCIIAGLALVYFLPQREMKSYLHAQDPYVAIMFISACSLILFSFALSNTASNALLLLVLPKHQQAQYQAPVQLLASLGRAIGPSISAAIIETSPPQDTQYFITIILTASVLVALSVWVPSLWGARFLEPPVATQNGNGREML